MTANNQAARTSWLKRVAGPPEYTAEDKAQIARNLNVLLPAAMLLLGIQVVLALVEDPRISFFKGAIVVLIVVLAGLWILERRGYVLLAATLLIIIAFVSMVFIASQANRLFDGAFAGLIVVILMAGVLLGWKAAIVMTALSIAAAWWLSSLYAAERVILDANAPSEYARDVSIVYALVAVLLYLLIRNLQQAVSRSRADEQIVREQNAELTAMQTTLEHQVAERTEQLRTAADVGRVAISILDPSELLREIANLITERFAFYYAAIFLVDPSRSYLILREATGEAGQVLKERGHRLHIALDSMVGYAVVKREPRVAVNAGEDAVRFANPLLPDTQSEIALPLLVGDQVLGALDVQSTQLNAFDEATIATLQNVAAQIAVALQNAQSYQRQQEALNYTTGQYELTRTIFTARSAQEAYQALGQVFAMLRGVDRISMLRITDLDATGQPTEYELVTEWDVLGGAQFDTGQRYSAVEAPFAPLVTPDKMVIIRDASDNRLPLSTREHLARVGVQAALLVPLTMRGQYQGFIAAVVERPHDFQESEVRLVKSAAEQLGVVLSNLQLTTEMQATLERVALLNRRLSGEAWGSYLTSRDQWVVESGHSQSVVATNQLQVPIVVRGETIGAFDVADARADRQWQEDELTMLQTIAGEVALAIENARLIEQTQRTAQREKDIADAADKIHRSIDLDAILQTAVQEVMRIAGTTEVAIQLGRPATISSHGQQMLRRETSNQID
ncbi:MAG TPA: GAF domain-containing protein [Anaerolineae bacterium]|nr:GAF domain-containing protein [Anaerolineae bacterium]